MMDFFRDDSVEMINANQEKVIANNEDILEERRGFFLTAKKDSEDTDAFWKKLRLFFQTSEGGSTITSEGKKLHSLFEFQSVQDNEFTDHYPYYCDPEDPSLHDSLVNLINKVVDKIDDKELEQGLFHSRLTDIVKSIGKAVNDWDGEADFQELLETNVLKYGQEIGLASDDFENYRKQWAMVKAKLPKQGILISRHKNAAFDAIATAAVTSWNLNQTEILERIQHLVSDLQDRLDLQDENKGTANSPDKLSNSLGEAQSMLNLDKLSNIIPKGGSKLMSEAQTGRIKAIIETLQTARNFFSAGGLVVWQSDLLEFVDKSLVEEFSAFDYKIADQDTLAEQFLEEFNERMKQFTLIISALRRAELEIADTYDADIHDVYFEHFQWRLITHEEMRLFPPILVFMDSKMMDSDQMSMFSMTLRDNLPVQLITMRRLVTQQADHVDHETFFHRFELAAMAVSYRHAFVMQATASHPGYIHQGVVGGLKSGSTAVYHILLEDDDTLQWSQAARSSRAFPHFYFTGQEGSDWGSRFDMSDNPALQDNWIHTNVSVTDEDNELEEVEIPLCYADYKVLNERYTDRFLVIPRSCWTGNLVHITTYIQLPEDEQASLIPYIWMAEEDGQLCRVAVSWEMTSLVADKLDYWHFVQENGGVNSYHVRQALASEKRRLQEEAEAELESIKKSHDEALQAVKEESTAQAMERLTSMLLDLDTDQMVISKPSASPVQQTEEAKEGSEVEEIAEEIEEEESLSMDEPWIETPLCTSCNECIQLNGQLFKYNADKMAVIGDPSAGTYEDLVEAAEKCPVRIIHPGKPMNPQEANLEELMARAAKFN